MDWLTSKYINILSLRLDKFTKKGPSLYNFRCPLCGDSQKHKEKARAYLYEKSGKIMFHCHNCNAPVGSFDKFLKLIDQNLYSDYVLEKLKENRTREEIEREEFIEKLKKPVFLKSGPLRGLKKVSQLSVHDPVKKYVDSRKIPNPYHAKLMSCPNFFKFTNDLVPGKFSEESLRNDETRLLIPFFDSDKNLFAYQGRTLNTKAKVKYITILLNSSMSTIYGLDAVNLDKTTYVFEGPIDSMFIPNSIATAGGDLVSTVKKLPKENLVIVYDNERRSRDTVKKIEKAIYNGYKVCIWPENFDQKDVNNMVLSGLTPEFIKYIIDSNTYKDLEAKLILNKWSRA